MKRTLCLCLAAHALLCLLGGAEFLLMLLFTDGWLFGMPFSPAWALLFLPNILAAYGLGRLLRRRKASARSACRRAALGIYALSLFFLLLLALDRDTLTLWLNLYNLPFLPPLLALDALPGFPLPFPLAALLFAAAEPFFLARGLLSAPRADSTLK